MGEPGMSFDATPHTLPIVHDFRERNQWSLSASDEPFWAAVYNKAFPGLLHTELNTDIDRQKQGIDRVLYLANGNVLYVDEKKRERVYSDILLEYVSVDSTGAPGWIEKDLAIDYLAYAFIPSKLCYLFPWPMLRRAWLQFRDAWKQAYVPVRAQNRNYVTWSLPVPISVLQRAVSTAAVIDVASNFPPSHNHGG